MRLTCPECGAQYEIPDEVIPQSGREVECSNCGQSWFQNPPGHAPAEAAAPEPDAEEEDEIDFAPEEDEEDEAEVPAPLPPAPDFAEEEPDESPSEEAPAEIIAPPRRPLDPSVADVLRQEAAREREARAGERQADAAAPAAEPAATDPDDLRPAMNVPPAAASRPADAPVSRRNLLPDVDALGASLDADRDRPAARPPYGGLALPEPAERSGGFAKGFLAAVTVAALLALLYVFADDLGRVAPPLQPALAVYVEAVEAARLWLNETLAGLARQD